MARYRVLDKSFINNTLFEPGAEIDYDGDAGANLELIESPKDEPKPKKSPKAAEAADALV